MSGLSLGLSWAALILAGLFVGRYLDQRLDTGVVFTLVGLLAGLGVALVITIRAGLKDPGSKR